MNSCIKNYTWEIFICHASEDKDKIARPLADILKLGYGSKKVWFDENSILDGDPTMVEVLNGVSNSRVLVLIISPQFLKKKWPWIEIGAFLKNNNPDCLIPLLHDITYINALKKGLLATIAENNCKPIDSNNILERAKGIQIKIDELKRKEKLKEIECRKNFIIKAVVIILCLSFFVYFFVKNFSLNRLAKEKTNERGINVETHDTNSPAVYTESGNVNINYGIQNSNDSVKLKLNK